MSHQGEASPPPAVAFAVVTWNNREIVADCLQSLLAQAGVAAEIFVLDNGSTDGTADFIAREFPTVSLLRSDTNLGYAAGNNRLVRHILASSGAEYIALVNSDVRLAPGWANTIVPVLSANPHAATAQGLTLDARDPGRVDSQHIYMNRALQCIQYGYGTPASAAYRDVQEVFGVNAAAAIVTRRAIEAEGAGGLFDEQLFMYLEDVDLAFRFFLSGWHSYSVPDAVAYHLGSASAGSAMSTRLTYRNNSALIARYIPVPLLLLTLPAAIVAELRQYVRMLRSHGWSRTRHAIAGRIAGLAGMWRSSERSRRRIPNSRLATRDLWGTMRNRGFVDVPDAAPNGR